LASWRKPREAAGKQKLKDHHKLCARTARDYSTTFGAGCKDPDHIGLPILLTHRTAEWKKIRPSLTKNRTNILYFP